MILHFLRCSDKVYFYVSNFKNQWKVWFKKITGILFFWKFANILLIDKKKFKIKKILNFFARLPKWVIWFLTWSKEKYQFSPSSFFINQIHFKLFLTLFHTGLALQFISSVHGYFTYKISPWYKNNLGHFKI